MHMSVDQPTDSSKIIFISKECIAIVKTLAMSLMENTILPVIYITKYDSDGWVGIIFILNGS